MSYGDFFPPNFKVTLERNVVIHIREVRRRLWCLTWRRRGHLRAWGRGLALRRGFIAAAVVHAAAITHALTATQHLHLLGDDVSRVFLYAILVGVLAGLQAAFNVDRRALFQVLADDFGQAAEERDAVPFGLLFLLAGVAVFRFVRCRACRSYRGGMIALLFRTCVKLRFAI